MIQPNELRIGNWVSGPDNHQYQIKIEDLYFNHVPILITNEILVKFGFEKISGYYSKSPIVITDRWVEIEGYNYDYSGAIVEKKICKHLHQLQNLYFALTGEELEYKS